MPINDKVTVSGVNQAGITIGASYNPFTGVKDFAFIPELITSDLTGDGGIQFGALSKPSGKTTFDTITSVIPLTTLALMLGVTPVDTGATPNMIKTYTLLAGQCLSDFEFECRADCMSNVSGIGTGTEPGDIHLVFAKCKATGINISIPEKDYAVLTFNMIGFANISTKEFMKIVLNETAVVIS